MGLGYTLNRRCPAWILEIISPVYHHCVLETRDYRRYWRWFDATDCWTRDELLAFQWTAMKRLLGHAYQNVPFYRELWKARQINIHEIDHFGDLVALPLLTKNDIRQHRDLLLAVGVDTKDLIVHETGGSTGTPLRFFYDGPTAIARAAAMRRWEKYAGQTNPNDRQFYMGRPSFSLMNDRRRWGEHGEQYFGDYFPLTRRGTLAATNLSDEVLEKYCDLLEQYRPPFLKGYSSALYILADYCLQAGRRFDFIKAVMTSSDMLSCRQREVTKTVWNCEIFDRYGQGEEVSTAVECSQHNGYHIDMAKCLVEIVDEQGQQMTGTAGRLVGTCLTNYAMPLIRYDTGDRAILTDARCPCGRESIMLSRLEGRTDDVVIASSGRGVSASVLGTMVVGLDSIREVQYVQHCDRSLTVRLSCSGDQRERDTRTLCDRLRKQLGSAIPIQVEYVDRIPRGPNGKFRQIISDRQEERSGATHG